MFAMLLALTLPLLQTQALTRELSTRWHYAATIETGLNNLAFVAVCPNPKQPNSNFVAVDSNGTVLELGFVNRQWQVLRKSSVGERVVAGCAAAMRPDEVWSLVVGTESGKIIEMRRSDMGWGRYEVGTAPTPIHTVATTEPARPGPSQIFVIDGQLEVTNWYVGGSGRWVPKPLPSVFGGHTNICFDYPRIGLCAITAGKQGVIHKFIQDSLGDWDGSVWATLSSPCRDLAPSADPTMKDICIFYSGADGHLRYLFDARRDDVTARLTSAEGAHRLIGKGDQRRFNEFFGMVGSEFCLFEYDPGQIMWVKVPIRSIPGTVVCTLFGPARGAPWHTIYVATADGKIVEFERDGLENE